LIGVISRENEKEVVTEFFELFKTPWEFYQGDHCYEAVVTTVDCVSDIPTNLIILYASTETDFDRVNRLNPSPQKAEIQLAYHDTVFPIYGNSLTFEPAEEALLTVEQGPGAAAIAVSREGKRVLRIGFDLFQEVGFLLSTGQPPRFARIPTLDVHITILRNCILASGIPLTEIPPVPAGYDFISCLTHDVDFTRLTNHFFDHTMFGFLYRASIGSFLGFLSGRRTWKNLLKNWKAAITLPAVYLNLADDFWLQFHRYAEIEDSLPSTFFVIPFKNDPGCHPSGRVDSRRASQYDATEIAHEIEGLISSGHEIGVHGIDAWHDRQRGRQELRRISELVGQATPGIRMHWLYFDTSSPQHLEDAGFLYDSTRGYNDAIGYHAGTSQVFRPLGATSLLELPLNIQDTALFFPSRMSLKPKHAWPKILSLLSHAKECGGALTLNWHHRSIAPERLWDDFYVQLLLELRRHPVWFATAKNAVKWFQKRRDVRFRREGARAHPPRTRIDGYVPDDTPDLLLRTYHPTRTDTSKSSRDRLIPRYDQRPIDEAYIHSSTDSVNQACAGSHS